MKKIEYFTRNKTLLADGSGYRKDADAGKVNLNWWHIRYEQKEQNLGDMLSEVVVHNMCERLNIDKDKRVGRTKHLYAIGSILYFENQDATVWGTGCLCDLDKTMNNIIHQKYMRTLDVRMVRGPKTQESLNKLGIKCPSIYGDPAMLMPLFYTPNGKKCNKTVVISHFKDKIVTNGGKDEIVYTNMVCSEWRDKIDLIASARCVISSSLHGVILAESYGVPAVVLQPKAQKNIFKYEDYYYGTGRKKFQIVNSVEDALKINFDDIELPDVKAIQENLIYHFPKDLWRG